MRELRRKDRSISNEETFALLKKAGYGVLSTVTEDGKPYGVPLNYCIIDNGIYFHCAIDGQKIDNIEKNQSASFCVVGDIEILPDTFSTRYESVIVTGEIEEVFHANKQLALEGLLRKYSPNFFAKGLGHIQECENKTRVFKMNINRVSGKARK